MEALASAVFSGLVDPIRSRIINFWDREQNFEAMKCCMSSLLHVRDDLKQKLDHQDHQTKVMKSQVADWMKQVDDLEEKVNALISKIDANNLEFSWSNFVWLCGLSNQMARQIEELNKLIDSGNLLANTKNVIEMPISVEYIPGPSIKDQKRASKNIKEMIGLLSNDRISRIGICGMGGVGKTTLALNLNNELGRHDSSLDFSIIIWVKVLKDGNLKRIQMRIAERLKMEVKNEDVGDDIAIRLLNRLLKEKRFLLILDDVWESINLDSVGIPRPELCPGSKIIVTSRSLDVCRKMKTEENFEVKVLNDEESWELFRELAGDVVVDEGIKPVAKVIAKKWAGLPSAITVVAESMRGKSIVALWEDALRELQSSKLVVQGIEERVYSSMKQSYDSLPRESLKLCFLYWCLYPRHKPVKVRELVRHWYCEGLLDKNLDYEQLENQGMALIQSLKDWFLLEYVRDIESVKMHDVVRRVGKWIANSNEDECESLVRSGNDLTCVSRNEYLCTYERVSFKQNQIDNASTLLCQYTKLDKHSLAVLIGNESLIILDLSKTNIETLPPLLHLKKLRALILKECTNLKELPPLDGLINLLVLDCSWSGVTRLPESLGMLSNLRQLDISFIYRFEAFPYRSISKLSNLEFLDMRTRNGCSIDGQRLFEEVLPFLHKLIEFGAHMETIPVQTKTISMWPHGRIRKFGVKIGRQRSNYYRTNYPERSVCFEDLDLSKESIVWLLSKAVNWECESCVGLVAMLQNLVLHTSNVSGRRSFTNLKVVKISKSDLNFQTLDYAGSFDLLPNLKEIHFTALKNLESISAFCAVLGVRYSSLERINIVECPQMKCLFSLEENQTLPKLEKIKVWRCDTLKCLFQYSDAGSQHDHPTVPSLQEVDLSSLPNLENICCKDEESWQKLRRLRVVECRLIKKLPLTAETAHGIKEIRGEQEWWNQLEWESEDDKMLLQDYFTADINA